MLTHIRLLGDKRAVATQRCNISVLKGWRPKTESDECGFGRVIVESLEAAEDVMGEVSIEDITECIPKAARAVEFESAGREKQIGKEDNRTS